MSEPSIRPAVLSWTVIVPILAFLVLTLAWGRTLPGPIVVLVSLLLAVAVLAAVHHAEVVALRVGSLGCGDGNVHLPENTAKEAEFIMVEFKDRSTFQK